MGNTSRRFSQLRRPWDDNNRVGSERGRSMVGVNTPANEFAPVFDTPDNRRRYEILRVVNRGGMGEIALGQVKGTKGFEKLVVLKRLRADAEREDHIAMFDVEQEVMSKIEHPNIVKVFDQPVVEGIPYLAMEYIRGRNLDQLVRAANQAGEEVPLNLSLTVISEVLRGLAFVHRLKDSDGRALGVVHQDMTPSNVLVSFFGEVKITDFGISYVTSRDGGLRKGVLKGKPRYVAPEVLAGKRVNNRADIYGVGVVLYEMLTGRALFARSSVKETLAAVARNELPDFSKEFEKHGPGVARILERSLSKDPVDRYRTAEAMAADVLNEMAKRGGPMPPATLGYLVRQLFRNDPDVPEMDPALEEAITAGTAQQNQSEIRPTNLDDTLLELDRLLGPSESVDLFTLPPELENELGELKDNDPFQAKTPLPDFVWEAKNDQELLEKANQAYGGDSLLVGEPPSLYSTGSTATQAPPAALNLETPTYPAPPATEKQRLSASGEYSHVAARSAEVRTPRPLQASHEAPTMPASPPPTPAPAAVVSSAAPVMAAAAATMPAPANSDNFATIAPPAPAIVAPPAPTPPAPIAAPVVSQAPAIAADAQKKSVTAEAVAEAQQKAAAFFWRGLVLGMTIGTALGAAAMMWMAD